MATGTIKTRKMGTQIFPLSTDYKSNWSYTAPRFGILQIMISSWERQWANVTVNDNAYTGIAFKTASTSQNAVSPLLVFCNAGDVISVTNLNDQTYIVGTLTWFQPII